jgi:hypothetical protein
VKKKSRKLTPAQLRVYRRGLARGKVLAAESLRRKRKAAARKAAETRKLHPKKKKPPAEPVVSVAGELVLYEAPDAEGVPILSGLSFAEWVSPSDWEARVELWVEGKVVAEGAVTMPAEWDNEAAAKLIRREVRSWYEAQVTEHPAWRESPAATLIRLSLRRS